MLDNKLQTAVRLGLGIGAGALAVGFSPGAVAQDAGASDEVLEEIITTGSRIKRADLDSASPVTVIDREVILSQGLTDVGNLLQRMPSMSGSPIGTTTNNGGNGSVQIDLRGMGVDRTLTLVNGFRTVDGGDYQTIPANMIERVEILKDGASAVYGADAVAGVVNIITRRDFEGFEITAQSADFMDMEDGAQSSIGIVAGKLFDGGNILFGAEYVDQAQAFQSDAPWDYFQDSYYIYPEGCEKQLTAPYDGTASGGCYPIGSSRIPESRLTTFSQGRFLIGTPATSDYEVGTMIPHDGRSYNYAPVNYIQTPYKRTNIFAESHFDLTENVRFNMSARGNFRQSKQELAPLPFTDSDPMHDGFYLDPATGEQTAFHGIHQDNYYLGRAFTAYNNANAGVPGFVPLVNEPVMPRRRMIETNRNFTQDITQIQALAGLEGTFANGAIDWEIHYNAGYRARTDVDSGMFSGARLHNAMGPSADFDNDGQPECYADVNDPNTLIVGCVPFNLFGGGAVDPVTSQPTTTTVTQDMVDYISVTLIDTIQSRMDQVSASLSGSAFDMPGGEMGWAVGYGYWGQKYTYSPDSGKQTGAVTGNVGAGTDGSLYNNSLFGEVLLPVLDNGSQALDLKAGVRYDDWNAFDADTTWQVGVEFQAIDSLKFRATAGTIFRAPTISDLFGGTVDSFPTFSDPCNAQNIANSPNCPQIAPQFDNQLKAQVGGNPNLVPETGETFTAGLVWSPGDVSITLDYWQVEIEEGISSLGVQFTLDDCYVNGNQAACNLITRNADFTINNVIDGSINVADQGAAGIDTEVRWSADSDIGQWDVAFLWSHLLERTKTPQPGADENDLAGRYSDTTAEDGGAYASDKMNVSVQWGRNDFSVGYLAEYISGLDADTFCNCGVGNRPDGSYIQKIDAQLYHDIIFNYTVASTGTNIAAGITNITDEEPPYIDMGFGANTDPSTYRLFGMGYYVRLTQTFE